MLAKLPGAAVQMELEVAVFQAHMSGDSPNVSLLSDNATISAGEMLL